MVTGDDVDGESEGLSEGEGVGPNSMVGVSVGEEMLGICDGK